MASSSGLPSEPTLLDVQQHTRKIDRAPNWQDFGGGVGAPKSCLHVNDL
jgi:hypothetical protein